MGTTQSGYPGGAEMNPGFMANQYLKGQQTAPEKKTKQPSAEAMADKALSRDEQFAKLYKMVTRMERYAESKLGDYRADASDVVNKALEYAITSIDSGVFRFDTTLESWFRMSVNGRIQDKFRSTKARKNAFIDQSVSMDETFNSPKGDGQMERQYADAALNVEQALVADSDMKLMRKGIAILLGKNEKLGQVMSLVADGLENQEIAKKLGISSAQVKDFKFKGTNALREIMETEVLGKEKLAA